MKYENDFFTIKYNECDRRYIDELIEAINSNLRRIMEFFEISEFQQKKSIRIWNNLDTYIAYLIPFIGEYCSWMVADTFDNNINILSYDIYLSDVHKNISDYKKIIIHELVHSCQQEINSNARNVVWFWEALATNLANQEYMIIDIPYSKDDIMFNFHLLGDSYATSFAIGKYLVDNYQNSKILQYVKYPDILINDTEHILEKTKLWIQDRKERN